MINSVVVYGPQTQYGRPLSPSAPLASTSSQGVRTTVARLPQKSTEKAQLYQTTSLPYGAQATIRGLGGIGDVNPGVKVSILSGALYAGGFAGLAAGLVISTKYTDTIVGKVAFGGVGWIAGSWLVAFIETKLFGL